MEIRFVLTDVFTDRPFGGNQLAVVPDARGLSGAQMQAVAREFNFSETTFVLPPADHGNTRRVRIFTPATELPFAGHPNVGTAAVLAATGELGATDRPLRVAFEEEAGLVRVDIDAREADRPWAELTAPNAPVLGGESDPAALAGALALDPADVVAASHPPRFASAGVWFLIAELRGRDALARATPDAGALAALPGAAEAAGNVFVYTRDTGDAEADIRARMFAPGMGVPEDPATGAAAAAVAGLFGALDAAPEGEAAFTIAQGVEMGRPSRIRATAEKRGGAVVAARVGGTAILVGDGRLQVPGDPGA